MGFNRNQRVESCTKIHTIHVDASLSHASTFHLKEEHIEAEAIEFIAPIYVGEIYAAFMGLKRLINHARGYSSYQLYTDNSIVYYMLNKGRTQLKFINNYFHIHFLVFFTLINNFINIKIFFMPSADNLADQFTRHSG